MDKQELFEELRKLDEVLLLELLNLTSEELVDAFHDRILEKEGYLRRALHDA